MNTIRSKRDIGQDAGRKRPLELQSACYNKHNLGGPVRCLAASTILMAALAVLASMPVAIAQEALLPIPVALTASPDKKQVLVELEYGMPRQRVLDLMGPPNLESLIGSLARARVTYEDGTELLFEDDRLIAIKTPVPTQATTDGRLAIERDAMAVVFRDELILPEYDPLVSGDERLQIDDHFHFAGTVAGSDPYDIHFTPATPQCLLEDCPGCETCGQGRLRKTGNVWVSASALFLHRDADGFSLPLLAGINTIQTNELSHGLTPGIDISTTLNLTGTAFLEFEYIGSHEWSAQESGGGLLPFPDSLSASTTYDAELQDLQVTVVHRRPARPWSLSWGVRYSEHEDDFTSVLTGQFASGAGNVPVNLPLSGSARNRLIGLQVGAEHLWWCGPVELIAGVKGGVLHNEIEQRGASYASVLDLEDNATSAATFGSSSEEVSFMGDFELSARYPIATQAAVQLGYRGLVLSDVAQVADQNGRPAEPASLSYNGVFAGAEFWW